jgi:hypothetical protein
VRDAPRLWRTAPALRGAFDDFQDQMRAGRRMLLGRHRFWTLVKSIDARKCRHSATRSGHGISSMRLQLNLAKSDRLQSRAMLCTQPPPNIVYSDQDKRHSPTEVDLSEILGWGAPFGFGIARNLG